ncbi:MAG: DUF2007 domain-containing protein [Bacteroidota bacterium]|jgi:hypothetical protein
MQKFVLVATYPDDMEARLAQATLAAAEIESFIKADDAGGMLQFLEYTKGVQLLVGEKDLEEAKVVLSTRATGETNP